MPVAILLSLVAVVIAFTGWHRHDLRAASGERVSLLTMSRIDLRRHLRRMRTLRWRLWGGLPLVALVWVSAVAVAVPVVVEIDLIRPFSPVRALAVVSGCLWTIIGVAWCVTLWRVHRRCRLAADRWNHHLGHGTSGQALRD